MRAYLDPEGIVAVAVRAGADAVYPGYGFLSENPGLAEACANARACTLSPNSVSTPGGGPMNVSPFSAQRAAKPAFSERKP